MKISYSMNSLTDANTLKPINMDMLKTMEVKDFLVLRACVFVYNKGDRLSEYTYIGNAYKQLCYPLASALSEEIDSPDTLKGWIDKMPRWKVYRFISWLYTQHEDYLQELAPGIRNTIPMTHSPFEGW